ncbi:hypothetical protein [Pontibacter vulgaris]|uniref:hypothetical protein n=1 Tax=Pontibacter vulgaris TaxID=2905679 RepID=UPI001FA73C2F|nr:hypothetical protein [Pontibacter vulgaris]
MEALDEKYLNSIKHLNGNQIMLRAELLDGSRVKLYGDAAIGEDQIKIVNSYDKHRQLSVPGLYDYYAHISMPDPWQLELSFTNAKTGDKDVFPIVNFEVVD